MSTTVSAPSHLPEATRPDAPSSARQTCDGRPGAGPPARWAESCAQAAVLTLLYAAPALIYLHAARVSDGDIWWHLRTAEWTLAHRAVPFADPFSQAVTGQPWQAYSWLFDLIALPLYRGFGLCGLVGLTATILVLITAALHGLMRRVCKDFSVAAMLTFAALFSTSHLATPRPWLFTILLFIIELDLLLTVRRTGCHTLLWWLPPLFALWANLHIQFVDGLLVLALAVAEVCVAPWLHAARTRARVGPLAWAGAASIVATAVNPYGWHLYRTAYDLASQRGVMNRIEELLAIPFRAPEDYCLLALALAAAAALGRARALRVFETALFALAAFLSFRSQRDVWLMATAASAILGSAFDESASSVGARPAHDPSAEGADDETTPRPTARLREWSQRALAAALSLLLVVGGFRILRVNNAVLVERLAQNMPVQAVAYIQALALPGPVFNTFDWGGYLIFHLRRPVEIDGRAALYGDPRLDRSAATWSGSPDWASDPALGNAGVILGPVGSPLIQLLRLDPRFAKVYEDRTAAVFVPRARRAFPAQPSSRLGR